MARLPIPGGDNGTWGDLLNDFLRTSHNADGTLKENTVSADQINGTIPQSYIANLQSSLDEKATIGSAGSEVQTNIENEDTYSKLSNVSGFQAHFSIAQPVGYPQWTSIDNDPHDMLQANGKDFSVPESGLYDVIISPTWSSTTGLKIGWLMDNVAMDEAATGAVITDFDLQSAGAYGGLRFFEVPLTAGKWYRVYMAASSGTPTINTARISIRRTGGPFG